MIRIAAAACFLLIPVLSRAQAPVPPGETPAIVVVGEAVVQAVPDRAWITVGAESRASSAREAQRRNTELMTPVLEKLRSAGLPPEAIRTIGYDVQYEWDFVNNRRVGRGYVARNTVELRIDNVERVGEFLEIAAGSGATSLGGVRFDLKDRSQVQRNALRLAVEDARAKAQAVAAAAGRTIDRITRIEEQPTSDGPQPPMFRTAMAEAGSAPPISTGQIEVSAVVQAHRGRTADDGAVVAGGVG